MTESLGRVLLLAGLTFGFEPAAAQLQVNGTTLLKACQVLEAAQDRGDSVPDRLSVGYCVGIAEATLFAMSAYNDYAPAGVRVCFPKGGVTNEQAARVVLQYLRKTPEKLHLGPTELTMLAYLSAFACR